jgi:membrane-anchored mycosin MYCP
MAVPDINSDVPRTFQHDEIVVDLPYLDLVVGQLGELKIELAGDPDADPTLGLALIRLSVAETDLDPLLRVLRAMCAFRYGGWTPLLGKNRHVESVFGLPQPKSHSMDDDLARADPPIPVSAPASAGRDVRVGVLDTRVTDHEFLVGRYTADSDSIVKPAPGDVLPLRAGHATFVSSLVLAQAPGATLEVRGVLDDNGHATSWNTVRQMMAFADSGVDILNLSLGCRTEDGRPPLLMSRAVALLSQRMVLVAAAGNHNQSDFPTAPTWPAALPDVVAVGARDADDTMAAFSPRLPWIACTAPGRGVTGAYLTATVTLLDDTTQYFTGYARWSGTSFATAIASGTIAANTVPGHVSAREALAAVLAGQGPVVRKYVRDDDEQRA